MNFSVTCRCSAEAMPKRALPGPAAIFCLARLASWRQAGALRPTISATVSNGIWKISCSTKATRSAGLSCCSTTSKASLTPLSKVTRSAGSASPFWGGATNSIWLASRARSRRERGAAVRVPSPVSRPCLT